MEQPYSGEQINIEYANQKDTQFSVYVNGQKEETITLPDSDGERAVFSLVKHVDQDIIALAVDAEDAEVNVGASAVIYQIDLLKEAQRMTRTISVSHNAGGSVTPDGEWEVDYGASQTIAIHQIQAVFEPDVSKTALEELVGEANQLDEGSYTADSRSMLMRALEEAERILAAEGATQDEVDAAEEKLSLALDALVRIEDKTELNALIEKAEAYLEGEYTAESIAALRTAIDAAKIVADDVDAAAEEVSEAITNLSSAIAGLEKIRLDTSALEHEIELVSEMLASLDDYVPSSVEGLADKLAAAKETLMNAAEQSALDEATARLREARLMARTKADISALKAQAKWLISDPEVSQADVD